MSSTSTQHTRHVRGALLLIERQRTGMWQWYLASCRRADSVTYDTVESHSWDVLQSQLRDLADREQRIAAEPDARTVLSIVREPFRPIRRRSV